MNQINFDPWMNMEQQRRHAEVLKEAAQIRLAEEGSRSDMKRNHSNSKILALIKKELATLGARLHERYDSQPDSDASFSQQSNPGGCS